MKRPHFIFLLLLFFLVTDLVFLRWIWIQWEDWGFWDWDYQQTLLETTRRSWLEYGQLPLWNPYIGGGVSLAGNTLNHAWGPCFLPVLLFGTLSGIKLDILLYALIGQTGLFLYGRSLGLGRTGAVLAALLFIPGGVFAQRLTHGHFEWIAIAWIPWVLWALARCRSPIGWKSVALGGLFLAFIFLDGGPYQFAFFAVFAGIYHLVIALQRRSAAPLIALGLVFLLGAGLAAIKLFPMYETVRNFPREVKEDNFYGAPFTPTPLQVLNQSFLSRDQEHDADRWMPYYLNVGCYLGWIPVLLALFGAVALRKLRWVQIVCALFFLWIMLGSVLPWSPWKVLHQLPGLSMLRVPSRFNLFVVLLAALLAGCGLDELKNRWRNKGRLAWVPLLLVALVAVDLVWVNGAAFKVAFSIPPVEVEENQDYKQHLRAPHMQSYVETIRYETWPNWHSAAFPSVLENHGVIDNYRTVPFESFTLPFTFAGYRGEAWFQEGGGRVISASITPNRIDVTTNGSRGLLFINQNHDEGWKATGNGDARVINSKGLIALRLPPGVKEITLRYRPGAFYTGAAISAGSLILLLILFFYLGRKEPLDPVRP